LRSWEGSREWERGNQNPQPNGRKKGEGRIKGRAARGKGGFRFLKERAIANQRAEERKTKGLGVPNIKTKREVEKGAGRSMGEKGDAAKKGEKGGGNQADFRKTISSEEGGGRWDGVSRSSIKGKKVQGGKRGGTTNLRLNNEIVGEGSQAFEGEHSAGAREERRKRGWGNRSHAWREKKESTITGKEVGEKWKELKGETTK